MTSPPATSPASALPDLGAQAARLIELGVHELAGLSPDDLYAVAHEPDQTASRGRLLLALHPHVVTASALAPLLRLQGDRVGFVVEDMKDVDAFIALQDLALPSSPVYIVSDPDRGDHLANRSPNEALPALSAQGRTPLLLSEGIHWVLQAPGVLQRNRCFMTIGSRLRKPNGTLDARTPALWISNGTGRDGRERRDAPKIGWCWAGNRHTWLGFASAAARHAPGVAVGGTAAPGTAGKT
jgi:hypothetical protein